MPDKLNAESGGKRRFAACVYWVLLSLLWVAQAAIWLGAAFAVFIVVYMLVQVEGGTPRGALMAFLKLLGVSVSFIAFFVFIGLLMVAFDWAKEHKEAKDADSNNASE